MAMDYCGVTRAGKPTFVLSSSIFAVGRKSIQKQGLTEQKRLIHWYRLLFHQVRFTLLQHQQHTTEAVYSNKAVMPEALEVSTAKS
eukprot:scaffold7324_cov181-Alexandrium_tamarense.AAC.3